MYTIILDEGVVLDEAGVQVTPCQSIDEPAYRTYIQWIESGNQPQVIDTRG